MNIFNKHRVAWAEELESSASIQSPFGEAYDFGEHATPSEPGVMKNTQTTPIATDRIHPPLLRTLVVDDSAVLLEHLCRFLETELLLQVVGTARQGNEALYMAELLRPDLVLMDLNMPLVDGLEATAILRSRLPYIRVIIMTIDNSLEAQASARAHGAHGFILKSRIISGLMTEIRRVFLTNPITGERITP